MQKITAYADVPMATRVPHAGTPTNVASSGDVHLSPVDIISSPSPAAVDALASSDATAAAAAVGRGATKRSNCAKRCQARTDALLLLLNCAMICLDLYTDFALHASVAQHKAALDRLELNTIYGLAANYTVRADAPAKWQSSAATVSSCAAGTISTKTSPCALNFTGCPPPEAFACGGGCSTRKVNKLTPTSAGGSICACADCLTTIYASARAPALVTADVAYRALPPAQQRLRCNTTWSLHQVHAQQTASFESSSAGGRSASPGCVFPSLCSQLDGLAMAAMAFFVLAVLPAVVLALCQSVSVSNTDKVRREGLLVPLFTLIDTHNLTLCYSCTAVAASALILELH
jgi:hypothetical protein